MPINITFSDRTVRVAVVINGEIESLVTELPQRQWKEPTFDEQVLIAYAANGDVFKAIDITCAELKGMNYGQKS